LKVLTKIFHKKKENTIEENFESLTEDQLEFRRSRTNIEAILSL